MDDITVTTPRGGVVRLRSAPEHLIERVRELLPLGLEVLPSNPGTTAFGIVMQRGSKEAVALRQKTIEFSPEHAAILSKTHTMLVAIALAKFAKAALPGLLMPCPYFRINERNRIETGIAFFGGMPDFNSSNEALRQRTVFDDVMGHGFTDLWCQFTPILMACSQEYKLSLQRFIDLDLRYRSRLGSIEPELRS
jgi:hypothetical protein